MDFVRAKLKRKSDVKLDIDDEEEEDNPIKLAEEAAKKAKAQQARNVNIYQN